MRGESGGDAECEVGVKCYAFPAIYAYLAQHSDGRVLLLSILRMTDLYKHSLN